MALSQEAGQALLDAIQTISKSQMNNISFDETIVCTIVDDSHAKQEFYYVVSDGAIRFKAYVLSPDSTQYRVDDQVYVKIPKGDYTQQKIIEGYCLNGNNENLPNSYISPLNSFIEMSKLLTIRGNEENEGEEKKDTYINDGFTANLTKETLIGSWTISNSEFPDQEGNSLYDALGLSAKFITRFTSSPIIQGNYGIKLEIVSKVPNMDMSVTTKVFKLDSSEMIGNPYQFNFEHEQGKMFDISTLDTIETIRLYFYQDNNFYYTNDDKIEILPITGEPNIFIKDVQLSFGLDISKRDDNSLILYSLDNKIYNKNDHTNETNQKELNFIWVNKDEQGKYIGFSDGNNKFINEDNKEEDYDEIKFLRESEYNNNLLRQIGKNTPSDEDGLDVSYSVEEGEKIFNSIYSILNSELSNVLNTFKNRVKEIVFKTPQDNRDVEGVTNAEEYFDKKITIVNEFTSKFETDYKALIEWYKGALSAAANIEQTINERSQKIQESIYSQIDVLLDELRNDNIVRYWVTGTECKNSIDMSKSVNTYEIIGEAAGDAYDNFYKDGLFLDLKNEIDDNYSEFKGIYDIYMNRIINIINKLSSKFEKVEKLLLYKETKITSSSDQDDINNSEYQYTLSTLITPYEGKDYSAYDNKYCIYWYRYKPGCKNTKLYQNLPDENGEVRPEEERWFDVEGLIDDEWIRIGYYDNYYQHPEYSYNNYTKENYGRILQSSIKDDYLIKDGLETKREEVKGEMMDVIFPQYYYDLGLPNIDINSENGNFKEKPDSSSLINVYLEPETKQEKFKIVLYYNHEKFESNELVFTNLHANEVIDPILQETMSDVIITHGTNSQDSYQTFYSDNNVLINSTQVYTDREIKIDTTDSTRITKEDLINSWIYWYVPKANTMLTFDANKLTEAIYDNGEITNNPFFTNYYQTVKVKKRDDENPIVSYRGPGTFYKGTSTTYEENDIFYVYGERDGWYSLTPEGLIGNGGIWVEKNFENLQLITSGVVTGIPNEEGYVCFYKRIKSLDENDFNFFYKIKDYYSSDAINNTILCKIINEEKGISHETFITFTFGTQGNSGTDFSLHIAPIESYEKTNNENGIEYELTAYNHINEKIAITKGKIDGGILYDPNIQWVGPSIYNTTFNDNVIQEKSDSDEINRFTAIVKKQKLNYNIYLKEDYSLNNICGGIIELNVKYSNQEDDRSINNLTTRCVIPWSSGNYYIEGPISIIYDSFGENPIYYKQPYKIFNRDTNEQIINVEWKIAYFVHQTNENNLPTYISFFNSSKELVAYDISKDIALEPTKIDVNLYEDIKFYGKCMPTLDSNNKLIPLNIYITDQETSYLKITPVVQCFDENNKLLWAQPINIYQDKYPNQLINDWNGKFEINEENGTIFSTMVAAGYKGSDNTYYGVVMGDIQATGDNADSFNKPGANKTGLGLYGFNAGAQSFGLNIDGTAFFGKSGAGRIEFDGNKGIIKSASYDTINKGMLIDLDDGFIDMKGMFEKTGIYNESNEELSEKELQIIYEKKVIEIIKETISFDPGDPIFETEKELYLNTYPTYLDYLEGGNQPIQGLTVRDNQSWVRVDVKSPYFQITSDNGNQIMYIANNNYFLQSDNYSNNDNNKLYYDMFSYEGLSSDGGKIENYTIDENGYLCQKIFIKGKDAYVYLTISEENKYDRIYAYTDLKGNLEGIGFPSDFTEYYPAYLMRYVKEEEYYYCVIFNNSLVQDETYVNNGKEKRIQLNYSGTKFNLNNGNLNSYNLELCSKNIFFNSGNQSNLPYFVIKSNSYNNLLYVSDTDYYLQSNNYDDSFNNVKDGIRIDLYKKYIKTKNVQITTSNPYFLIKDNSSNVELVKFGTDAMFIQSPKYQSNTTGMRINLLTGNIDTKRIKIYSQESYDSKWLEDNATCFAVKDESLNNLIYIGNNADNFYIQSSNYISGSAGMKINLGTGNIDTKRIQIYTDPDLNTLFAIRNNSSNANNIIFVGKTNSDKTYEDFYINWNSYNNAIYNTDGTVNQKSKNIKIRLDSRTFEATGFEDLVFAIGNTTGTTYFGVQAGGGVIVNSGTIKNCSITGTITNNGIISGGTIKNFYTKSDNQYKGWTIQEKFIGTGTWSEKPDENSNTIQTECFYLSAYEDTVGNKTSPWIRTTDINNAVVFSLDRDGSITNGKIAHLSISDNYIQYSDSSTSRRFYISAGTKGINTSGINAAYIYYGPIGTDNYTNMWSGQTYFGLNPDGVVRIGGTDGTNVATCVTGFQIANAISSSSSDKNVKNSILPLDSQYEQFYDNLKPCKYKYNHGTSNRFHTGFIAQEVVEAIESANLTTQDFAGVMKMAPDDNGCEWFLRRDEFVALNTWQIQKLKSRISELENEILKIKGEKGLC